MAITLVRLQLQKSGERPPDVFGSIQYSRRSKQTKKLRYTTEPDHVNFLVMLEELLFFRKLDKSAIIFRFAWVTGVMRMFDRNKNVFCTNKTTKQQNIVTNFYDIQ